MIVSGSTPGCAVGPFPPQRHRLGRRHELHGRDVVRDAVFGQREIGAREVGHGAALSIGDAHLDLDQADLDPIVLGAQRSGERDDAEQNAA